MVGKKRCGSGLDRWLYVVRGLWLLTSHYSLLRHNFFTVLRFTSESSTNHRLKVSVLLLLLLFTSLTNCSAYITRRHLLCRQSKTTLLLARSIALKDGLAVRLAVAVAKAGAYF